MMLQGPNEDLALPLLLQRPIIRQTPGSTHSSIAGKDVMVTGAGGSIGSELVLQIAAARPSSMTLVDHSEYALYEINQTLENSNLGIKRMAALADIRDLDALRSLFQTTRPDIVFHAAALKHVPMLENDHNIVEAVRTNVTGTKHVADLCCAYGADMVFISTDKAVHPSSCMGLTKRVAEIYLQGKAARYDGDLSLCQVRFGNVSGSSGSVVPLFRRQIAQGGPVTITHPEMSRYMMTIKEAVGLTLGAADMNRGAHGYGVYVLDMGKPVKIIDLARQLIEQTGLRPDIDISLQIIGIRPGEKLHEQLHYEFETLEPTAVTGVSKATSSFENRRVRVHFDRLLGAAEARDAAKVKAALVAIVPEYQGEVIF